MSAVDPNRRGALIAGGVSAAVLLAALALLSPSQLASVGIASDPTTTRSDLIVRGDAGTLTRLPIAGASDGGVLTAAGGVVVWGPAPSAALPAASAAGELLVADGAGTAYSPTAPATVIEPVLADTVGATAGAAIIGDGAGGIQLTSAGVSSLLASASSTVVRQTLDATRVTTPDLNSATGWTVTDLLAGSGAITGGAYTSTIPVGTTAATGSYVTRAYTFAPQWELQGRVEITSDASGELLAGLSGVWSGGVLSLYVRGSGAFYLYQEGSWGFSGLTITGSSFPVDGTGWVRLRVGGTRVQVWSGIGSGSTPPTSWTLRADTTMSVAIGAAEPASVRLSGFSNDTHSVPSGTTVVWRSVTLTSLAGASP